MAKDTHQYGISGLIEPTPQPPLILTRQSLNQDQLHPSSPLSSPSPPTQATSPPPLSPPPTGGTSPKHPMHIYLPRFGSGDPTEWLYMVEMYAQYHGIEGRDRIILAALHAEPPASRWFEGVVNDGILTDWFTFTEAVHNRFGSIPTPHALLLEDLSQIKQTDSVLEYQSRFEKLYPKLPNLSAPTLLRMYMSGLKPDIQRVVQDVAPKNHHQAFALARFNEQSLQNEE